MFESIWSDIRQAFRNGSMVTRLVIINFSVFVLVVLAKFVLFLFNGGNGIPLFFDDLLHLFCMPSDWRTLLWHPWSPFTHMFLHEGFWHVLSNILFLYLLGTIVGDLVGDRRVLPIYLLGGLAGGFLFLLSKFFLHYLSPYALGASGAVMALAGAAVTLAPDYRVMLLLLGEVKLKYIVLVMLLLDLLGIANMDNTGGHLAHIGGFLTGVFLMYQLRDGKDWSEPVNRLLERFFGLFSGRKRTAPPAWRSTVATRGSPS
ncbi:MAG TPA: rhomboid family intramembrane serine protease, partial [Saprospiraceae bacterium]|nr:rhomboid family intramembrane serine protease [Saprospiraceae bacterium]